MITSIEAVARKWLDEQNVGQDNNRMLEAQPKDPLLSTDHELLPQLIHLAFDDDQEIDQLRSTIRRTVEERMFAGECGDCIAGEHLDDCIDRHVESIIQWLRQARQINEHQQRPSQ